MGVKMALRLLLRCRSWRPLSSSGTSRLSCREAGEAPIFLADSGVIWESRF